MLIKREYNVESVKNAAGIKAGVLTNEIEHLVTNPCVLTFYFIGKISMYVPVCEYVYIHVGPCGGLERVLDLLELEFTG